MKKRHSYSVNKNILRKYCKVLMFVLLQLVLAEVLVHDYFKYADFDPIELSDNMEKETDEMDDIEEEIEKEVEKDCIDKFILDLSSIENRNHKKMILTLNQPKRHKDKIPVPHPELS